MLKSFSITLLLFVLTANAYADLKAQIIQRRDLIKQWAPTCQNGVNKGQYSESYHECKQGDLAIFTGLSCLAATLAHDNETINERCSDIRMSQGSDGRWWRGPTRVNNWEMDMNAFSRDQAKGVLAYFTARGTTINQNITERLTVQDSARQWINWMDDEGNGQMCIKSTSNLCYILSGEPYLILNKMNIFPAIKSKEFKKSKTFRHLLNLKNAFWSLPAETILTPKGYQLHLKASTVLLRKVIANKIGASDAEKQLLDTTAHILYKKDSKNLYFEFLYKRKVNQDFVNRVFKQCPTSLDNKNRYFDWQWQRDVKTKPWKNTNGHDCIFLMNLMLDELN